MTETRKPGRPPERLTVVVFFKGAAFGDEAIVKSITWPKGWPLPEQGDQVFVESHSGIVNNRGFNPTTGTLSIYCR